MRFKDRTDAAKQLTEKINKFKGLDLVVYALPRGGVELGALVAKYLNSPLDLIIPRKIGHPSNPEYAVCALTDFGGLVCNQEERDHIDDHVFTEIVKEEEAEAQRRKRKYLKGFKKFDPKNKVALIVDDGVATGLTMRAAIASVKKRNPKKIIVVVPVIPRDIKNLIENEVDEVIALYAPVFYLGAVGSYYQNFPQVEDEEVISLMKEFHS